LFIADFILALIVAAPLGIVDSMIVFAYEGRVDQALRLYLFFVVFVEVKELVFWRLHCNFDVAVVNEVSHFWK
jgi:hypothetical protein